MNRKICIFTDQHLCSNPRVWKEADALARNGFDVGIVTIANNIESRPKDKAILASLHPSIRVVEAYSTISGELSSCKKTLFKVRTAVALLLKKAGIDTIYLMAKNPQQIYKHALKENADLYIGHVDCSLYVGKLLIDAGKQTAFDFEDWYSQDYISNRRPVNLLEKLEEYAMRNSAYIACPSLAMAKALYDKYSEVKMPSAIYNTFPLKSTEAITLPQSKYPVLVWFSQTIGSGRGLEKFIQILAKVKTPVKLLLVGDCKKEYEENLRQLFPGDMGHILEIHPQVAHAQLHSLLQSCNIGLALEDKYPESRNKTITNKILQYLQAGLKVLATNTDGQIEVAKSFPEGIVTVDAIDNSYWHIALQKLLDDHADSENITQRFNDVFPWSKQEEKILELVNRALEK